MPFNDNTRPPNIDLCQVRKMHSLQVRVNLASDKTGQAIRRELLRAITSTADMASDAGKIRNTAMFGVEFAEAHGMIDYLENRIDDAFQSLLGISIFDVVEAAVRQGISFPPPETFEDE